MGSTLSVKGKDAEINLGITSANVAIGTPNNSSAKKKRSLDYVLFFHHMQSDIFQGR
jgi:hypothetical protein